MPPGGDGFYYLCTFLLVNDGELGRFDIRLNVEPFAMLMQNKGVQQLMK